MHSALSAARQQCGRVQRDGGAGGAAAARRHRRPLQGGQTRSVIVRQIFPI